ncbi:MAG: NADPH-dependent F420 reductase [Gemmatimonadales bacterium]
MKIGVIGSGDVGRALATGFLRRGDEVMLSARDASKQEIREWAAKAASPHARTGTFADAAAFGEMIVLATSWSGTEAALRLAGADRLAGKVLIDVTNPLDTSGGTPKLALGHNDSGGESVQRWVPQTRVVKAFNIINAALMVHPKFEGGPPDMFIAGNDDDAKKAVTKVCTDFGWPVHDIGGIEGSGMLESLAMLWVTIGIRGAGWMHGFKLLQKGTGG